MSKKNKGNANRAAKRANAAKERRVQRNTQPQLNPEALKKFGEGMKKFSEVLAEKRSGKPIPAEALPKPQMGGQLTKPDEQRLFDDRIVWYWNVGRSPADPPLEAQIAAVYWKNTSEWAIDLFFPEGVGNDVETFTGPVAQQVAEALLSAVVWEHNWRNFVAEYLEGPTPEPEQVGVVFDPNVPPGEIYMIDSEAIDPKTHLSEYGRSAAEAAYAEALTQPPVKLSGTAFDITEGTNVSAESAAIDLPVDSPWCGGTPLNGEINSDGKAECAKCNRKVKVTGSGRLFPHKVSPK